MEWSDATYYEQKSMRHYIVSATLEGTPRRLSKRWEQEHSTQFKHRLLAGGAGPESVNTLRLKMRAAAHLVSENNISAETSEAALRDGGSFQKSHLIVIGASAGGPSALASVLKPLPRDFPAAVIIVQHIDEQFAPSMASWLDEQSALNVRVALGRDKPVSGTVLVASSNDHLVFFDPHTIGYTKEPRDSYYRPSIDIFFESVVRHWNGDVTGILLTGMGRDGAKGLKSLRDSGAMTIAQDAESCVVYGMPKAAAELGAAAQILSAQAIGQY